MPRIVDEWIEENTWKCSSCESINAGHLMRCKNCDSEKERHEEDIPVDPDGPHVADPKLLELANKGPHWICKMCNAQQRSFIRQCHKCGAYQDEQSPGTTQVGPEVRVAKRPPSLFTSQVYPESKRAQPASRYFFAVLVTVGGLATILALIWAIIPHEMYLRVHSTTWRTASQFQRRVVEHSSGWGSPFIGVFNINCAPRIKNYEKCNPRQCNQHYDTKQVVCGSIPGSCTKSCKSLKNGFSKCQKICDDPTPRYCPKQVLVYDTCYDKCPRYAQWCEYDQYVWQSFGPPVVASGDSPSTVRWDAIGAEGPDQRQVKSADYQVVFERGKKTWNYNPSGLDEFQHFSCGDNWEVKVSHIGIVDPQHKVTSP